MFKKCSKNNFWIKIFYFWLNFFLSLIQLIPFIPPYGNKIKNRLFSIVRDALRNETMASDEFKTVADHKTPTPTWQCPWKPIHWGMPARSSPTTTPPSKLQSCFPLQRLCGRKQRDSKMKHMWRRKESSQLSGCTSVHRPATSKTPPWPQTLNRAMETWSETFLHSTLCSSHHHVS